MALAYVNRTFGGTDGSATTIAAAAISHTAGNLLVVFVGDIYWSTPHNAVSSISDTAGNTYTYIDGLTDSDRGRIECWYAKNIAGNANNIVTATYLAAQTYRRIQVIQISGADISNPYDVKGTGSGTGTAGSTSSDTTTVNDEIIVAAYRWSPEEAATPGTNFTLLYDGYNDTWGDASEYRIVSTMGSYNSTMTLTGGGDWLGIHATFKILSAGVTWGGRSVTILEL